MSLGDLDPFAVPEDELEKHVTFKIHIKYLYIFNLDITDFHYIQQINKSYANFNTNI